MGLSKTCEILWAQEQVEKEHSDLPEETLTSDLVLKSVEYMKDSFLRDDGHWGRMESSVWEAFLEWLQTEGLLTSYTQSRNPVPGSSVTLDELRQGNVGSPLPDGLIDLDKLYTNRFLELAANHKSWSLDLIICSSRVSDSQLRKSCSRRHWLYKSTYKISKL